MRAMKDSPRKRNTKLTDWDVFPRVGNGKYPTPVTCELTHEVVEETSHVKIRGKDSPGRRNKSKAWRGIFLIYLRNGKKAWISGV